MTRGIHLPIRAAAMAGVAMLVALVASCARIEGVADGFRSRFGGGDGDTVAPPPAPAAPSDVDVSGNVVWDGRPSLGGVWVAHPDVADPLRVRIIHLSNGTAVEGWLFRRDPPETGPQLQISSEAAGELGVGANEPTALTVEPLGPMTELLPRRAGSSPPRGRTRSPPPQERVVTFDPERS